jgi:hypothetical protein
MLVDWKKAMAVAALLAAASALAGCSSIADMPLEGSARAKDTGAYLPVHDLPPDRDEPAIAPAERAKIEAELIAARNRQASAPAAKDGAAK